MQIVLHRTKLPDESFILLTKHTQKATIILIPILLP